MILSAAQRDRHPRRYDCYSEDQRKGDLTTADVETQYRSNGKRPNDVPLTFKVLLWRSKSICLKPRGLRSHSKPGDPKSRDNMVDFCLVLDGIVEKEPAEQLFIVNVRVPRHMDRTLCKNAAPRDRASSRLPRCA